MQVADLCAAIFLEGPSVAADTKGVFVMIKCLQQLATKCAGTAAARGVASGLADQLCMSFNNNFDKFK